MLASLGQAFSSLTGKAGGLPIIITVQKVNFDQVWSTSGWFQDLVMAGIGVCSPEEIALSVLTTVIGHRHDRQRIITDSGWMALSRDRGTAAQKTDQGYGVVCDISGTIIDELIVSAANQEHGVITRRDGGRIDMECFPVGRKLRILPNHACATAACFSRYTLTDHSLAVTGRWERINGWH